MKLKRILKGLDECQVKGSRDIEITGICNNSKLAAPGDLFLAKRGLSKDGACFITEAVQAGVAAVATDLYDPSRRDVVQVIHPDVASIEATIAANYYQQPSDELFLVGITGTNGKTTTSFLIKSLLNAFEMPCGLIGTIEYVVGPHRYPATRTTPDNVQNQKLLREMRSYGCTAAVMEVTSHALDQKRVDQMDFDVALFTNLTLDHLDYHPSMEEYAKAKRSLFLRLGTLNRTKKEKKWAVFNADVPWSDFMQEGCTVEKLTYGIESKADLSATSIAFGRKGTRCQISYKGETVACSWPLVGRFNVYNCLAAMSVLLTKGYSLQAVAEKMSTLPPVRGRLQPVPNKLGIEIYVDFAHSDDALKNVLETLTEFKKGRLITIFGCGGDRNRDKRPKMAAVCGRFCDLSIVTSDNPRSEDPAAIAQEIVQGFSPADRYVVELDRLAAIKQGISLAKSGDMILIAGKGHESTQIFAHHTIAFDDAEIAAQLCAEFVST